MRLVTLIGLVALTTLLRGQQVVTLVVGPWDGTNVLEQSTDIAPDQAVDIKSLSGPSYTVSAADMADNESATSGVPCSSTEAPSITSHPQASTNTVGKSVAFGVEALSETPVGYQWWKDGLSLSNVDRVSGAQSSLLTIVNVHVTDAGNYSVVITNFYGSVTSKVATLKVLVPPRPPSGLKIVTRP